MCLGNDKKNNMINQDISKKVLETIKEKKIKPKPRWAFLLKDYFIWLISIISLIIGSLAFSVIIFLVKNNDWDVYKQINNSLLEFTILTLPYLWFVILILFIIAAYYNFERTKKGYKYQLYAIVISSIIFSALFGALLYNVGIGQAIDEVFAEKVPFYEKFRPDRRARWMSPEKGLLAGRIISIEESGNFQVIDMAGNVWKIIISGTTEINEKDIAIDKRVRIIGQKKDKNNFIAKQILPIGRSGEHWFRRLPGSNGLFPRGPKFNGKLNPDMLVPPE